MVDGVVHDLPTMADATGHARTTDRVTTVYVPPEDNAKRRRSSFALVVNCWVHKCESDGFKLHELAERQLPYGFALRSRSLRVAPFKRR